MQKIAIIGPGSIGIAAQMAMLAPQYDVIGLADHSVHVDFETPGGSMEAYRPMPMSVSFDFDYNPTPKEEAWLLEQIALGERYEVKAEPVTISIDWAEKSVAKEAAWRAQQPRHQSQFTKSQSTAKARKAARKRAKAGRKAAR